MRFLGRGTLGTGAFRVLPGAGELVPPRRMVCAGLLVDPLYERSELPAGLEPGVAADPPSDAFGVVEGAAFGRAGRSTCDVATEQGV